MSELSKVTSIQVAGGAVVQTLEEACREYIKLVDSTDIVRTKINFAIRTKDGGKKYVTIRDEDNETIAYGDFEGLSSFFDYAGMITPEEETKI